MLQTLKIFALYVFAVTGMLGFMGSAEAQTRVSAGFEYGIIGESEKNAHQPERGVLISTLGISQVVISQLSNNGQFGGTQGNDYEVDVSILFNNGTTTTFAAAVNWRDTSGSTNRGIGLIRPLGSAADGSGYTPQSGYYTSYLLRFVNQTITYSETAAGEKIPEVSGNAATSGLLNALNAYSTASPPSSTPSVLQTTLTASSTSIAADGTATSTITVQLKDINGNDLSASGGTVALSTDAGTLSSATDNTDGTYTATLTSATTAGTATITGTLGGTAITDDATVEMTAGSAGQIGGTVLNRQGAAVAGVTVRLRNGSTVIATTTTDASGAYSFSTLSAGTYTVEFAPSAGGKGVKAKSNRGYQNGRFLENITLASDQSITDADAILIDPAGVVYDSITRSPVAGAVVTFNFNDALVPNTWLDQAAGGANTQTTGADGQYSFVLNGTAQSGTYTLDVATPTGYTFQSAVIPVTAGAFDPGLGGGIIAVQTQATAPTGGNATTYYLDFSFTIGTTASNTSNGVINNHIPIDPNPSTATSTITASPTSIVADGTTTSTVTVQLKDANGNDLSASGGTVALSTDAGTLSSATDNTDGTYTATLTSATTAGTATITGTLGGTAITDDATVEMTDATSPVITGPSGSAGDGTSVISVDENQTAVTTVTATDDVSASGDIVWSLSGDDSGKFTIATDGTITFNTAPDYENPTDADNNNTYVVTVTATDEATNASTQTLTVTVLDLDEVGPTITGPDGSGGTTTGATSAISVDENQTAVTTVTADETVTWTLTGSDDDAKFAINESTGVITFVAAPDYERPTDVGTNNTYVLTVKATDTASNTSIQTITVTVLDLDDDFAAVLVTNDDLIATEGRSDDNATMNFSLGGQPTSDVVLTFAGDAQCTVSPSTMTFKASDFATRQALSISAINDEDVEGTHSCQQTVEVASTDVRFDSFALALATVTVADDLVDQVRNPLKDILQSDFEQTVATQSRQFSQISKGALGRLQSDEEKGCGVVEALDADARAQAGAGGFSTSGVFGEEYYDCETGVRRILDGSFAINRSDAVDAQGIVSFTIQNEKQKADEALNGKFFGGYLSSSSLDGVATGNLRGVGVHAGLYGAGKLQSGLFFDYYAAGGVGRHEYDVSFYAPSAPITAEGDYRYGAVYAGAALSEEAVYESVTFRPRVGFDLTYADASDASVSASQLGFTDLGSIQLDAINGSRIFAETIWIFGDKSEDLITGELSLERALEVAPRLYCEQGVGRDERDCGYGGYISFNEHNLSKGSDIAITLDYENNTEGSERFGLDLSYSRDVLNGAGKLATQFGSDASGNATVSQSLSLEF